MAQNTNDTKGVKALKGIRNSEHWQLSNETKRAIAIVLLFLVSLIVLLAFFDAAGPLGGATVRALAAMFGWADWLVPILLIVLAFFLLKPEQYNVRLINYIGLVVTVLAVCGLLHMPVRGEPFRTIITAGSGGGLVGYGIGGGLYAIAALGGSVSILTALLLIGLFVFFNTSFDSIGNVLSRSLQWMSGLSARKPSSRASEEPDYSTNFVDRPLSDDTDEAEGAESIPTKRSIQSRRTDKAQRSQPTPVRRATPAIALPVDLLTSSNEVPASGDIQGNIQRIEATLKNFGIDVTMGEVNVGPTVTQYTLKPAEGVKLSQITGLSNDLALALAAHPIRIEAPIPGKSLVGIEVPNEAVSTVKLKEVLLSTAYTKRKTNLMIALGKDVSGHVMMADLGKMPHLLIAGATGTGKSVCINSMLIGLLYQNGPDVMNLIMVDPKRVEMTAYQDIPHLITPVITDVEKTVNALRWAVSTMDERYKLLEAAGKKNIESYNESRLLDKMPYIVIVIDELADLMMVAAKEVESTITRLAQMARAVGIHLILATQRPSVNVITGLIKANITSRIAFKVASGIDSRTILDGPGADKLLGRGDMLYLSPELSNKPKRLQGALVTEEEINAIADYLRAHGQPQYNAKIIERRTGLATTVGTGSSDDADEHDVQIAAALVVKARKASTTYLQSRMRIGFSRASRIMQLLEDRGIVGQQFTSKPRDVLWTEEDLLSNPEFIGPLEEIAENKDLVDTSSITEDELEDAQEDDSTEEDVDAEEEADNPHNSDRIA